jgi:hypothetical protein
MIKLLINRRNLLLFLLTVMAIDNIGQSAKRHEKPDTLLFFSSPYNCPTGGNDFFCSKGKYLEEHEHYLIFKIDQHNYFKKEVVHNDRLYNNGNGRLHTHAFKKILIDTSTVVGLLNSIHDSISKEVIKPFVYTYFDSTNRAIHQQLYSSHPCIIKYNVIHERKKYEVEINTFYLEQETSAKDSKGRILVVTKNDNYQYNSQLFITKLLVSVQNLAEKLKIDGQFILDR